MIAASVIWGRAVVEGRVDGHPCRMYAERPRSMVELLTDAQRWADRPFLVQGERRLTGKEFSAMVARAAELLRQRGAEPGRWVLLQGFNCIEWLVAFWALHVLSAPVALGNAWSSEHETATVLDSVAPTLVVAGDEQRLPGGHTCLRFGDLRDVIARPGVIAFDPPAGDEEAPALAIFSSGTTGLARGVVMSHRSVIANLHNLLILTGRVPGELGPAQSGTVSLVTMPLFHLGGIQTSILTMLTGGKIVFLAGRFDALEALRLIEAEKVRAWGSVPTMVSRVIDHPDFATFDTSSIASVQMGGASVPQDLRAKVQRAFPALSRRVGNMYGFTEAGGVLATGASADIEGRPGCVGRPLPTVELRIARPDADGVGEIVARTPTAVSGVLGEAMPIADAQGWMASGDLGRLDDEGRLYVTGRAKDIIIRGGENVSSARVEAVLRSHADVLEVAVVALPHADLGEEVCAAIVTRSGSAVGVEALRAHAGSQLAKFEVPSRCWLRTDALPVNATGKVAKRDVVAQWPQPYCRVCEPV